MSDFLSSVIPADMVEPSTSSPSTMLLIADAKIGKTTVAAALPGALHLVCDPKGGDRVRSLRVDINRKSSEFGVDPYNFLLKLCWDLSQEKPRRFRRAIVDKIDNLEDWAEREATAYYKSTLTGSTFKGRSCLEVPKGGGYPYFWESFKRAISALTTSFDEVLFLAALKDSAMDLPSGQQTFSRKDLDLKGKIRNITSGLVDLIGLMQRNEQDENWITFETRDKGHLSGSRLAHLEGRKVKISKKTLDTPEAVEVTVDWGPIFEDAKPVVFRTEKKVKESVI